MTALILNPDTIRDIRPLVLDSSGTLKVVPARVYHGTTRHERALMGVREGLYGLPTQELVSWLTAAIAGRAAIEIGSGNGILAAALGIQATDSKMQLRADIAAHYKALNQATIRYGANVAQMDALAAVKHFKPEVVIASWVTHKYEPTRHEAGGNMYGVVEEEILANCKTYIHIGNTAVHAGKSIWARPHHKIESDWLFSRAANGSADFIAIWGDIPSKV